MIQYYTNIDEFSVFNWRKCTNGNFTYTRLDVNKGTLEEDVKAWDLIFTSYIAKFGLGEKHDQLIELKRDCALLQCDLIITGNRFLMNKINVLLSNIEDVVKESEKGGQDLTTTLLLVGKWFGSKLPEKETTVLELFTLLDIIKKEVDEQKKDK
jgi:hypothetical protein